MDKRGSNNRSKNWIIKFNLKLLSCFLAAFMIFGQINIQNVFASENSLTLVSAVTDHIGKKIILTFDKPMIDPTGTQNQFTVVGKYTQYISSTNKGNFVIGNIPVTSVALGSDSTQIILSMSTAIQTGDITLDYTKGSVQASDETQLESFTAQSVTNNNNYSTIDMVDFDYDATEIGYDISDPTNPILKYRYDNLIDYDNVQLAWYFYNGFFTYMVDNLNNYVKFYEKDTGENVNLPNILTRPNSPDTYKDGTTKSHQIVTDWHFWQLQHYAPLALNLVSQALKPSTTYVIEIDKGFKYNNNAAIQKTYSFEFTTTADKPYWAAGSSVTASNITENSLTLVWAAAQDNHKVTGYNIYKNGDLLTTVDGDTTSYNVSNLLSGTGYTFKVEAVDAANNHSSNCIEVTQVTSISPVATTLAVNGPASVFIPTSSSTTVNYTVTVKDQFGNNMNGENINWSLQSPLTGVHIDSSTGVVTIDSTAAIGSFTVVAADGSLTSIKTVNLMVTDDEKLAEDKEALAITYGGTDTASSVTQDITLPQGSLSNGTIVTWISSNPSVIGNDGTVNRPDWYAGDATVTMIANLTNGKVTDTKTFTFTVAKKAPALAPAAPNVTADDAANTVSGMAVGMEYSLDGTGYVPYDAAIFKAIDFSGNHILDVRVSADEITGAPASAATTLKFKNILTDSSVSNVTPIVTNNSTYAIVTVDESEIKKDGINVISPIVPSDATSVSTSINVSSIKNGVGVEKIQAIIGGNDIALTMPFDAVDLSSVNDSAAKFVLSQSVNTDSTAVNMLAAAPSDHKTIGKVFSFTLEVAGSQVHNFVNGKAAIISLKLTEDDIKGLDTSKLSAFYYDETAGKWDEVGGIYNPDTMIFTFSTTHFSSFTVMQKSLGVPSGVSLDTASGSSLDSAVSSTLPKTGSPLDFYILVLIGISLLVAGIFFVLKRTRRNTL